MKPNTRNAGADEERHEIMRKIKRTMANLKSSRGQGDADFSFVLQTIIDWIEARAKRNTKRKGGLGRK